MSVLVSINCITYNHEAYIRHAIEGFLMQRTEFAYEILIGEDCSTDRTREIVEGYRKQFPDKIRIITSQNNVGPSENSLRLLEASQGKYIALCEGDDYWTDPYKLQKQVDYMENHSDCTLCFHGAKIFDEGKQKMISDIKPYANSRISPVEDIIFGGGGFCPTASLLFRKQSVEQLPLFFQKAHVGDYPLQMYLASQGYAYYMDEMMAVYRYGAEMSWNYQLNSGEDRLEKAIQLKEADNRLLEEFHRFTNGRYLMAIESTKRKNEFAILLLQNRIGELKKQPYRTFYKELTVRHRMKLRVRYHLPKVYRWILEMKKLLKKLAIVRLGVNR